MKMNILKMKLLINIKIINQKMKNQKEVNLMIFNGLKNIKGLKKIKMEKIKSTFLICSIKRKLQMNQMKMKQIF